MRYRGQCPEMQESAMNAIMITAVEMAKEGGVNPKVFQAALRRQHFRWHFRDSHCASVAHGNESETTRTAINPRSLCMFLSHFLLKLQGATGSTVAPAALR
jgi:hypothetical protein